MLTDTAYINLRQVGPPASLASQLLQGWGKTANMGRQENRFREQARSHRKAKQRSCPRRSRPTQQ
ncbi:hypothetical protein PS865_00455 [Pseudomonas fluorescens]|jgi:hypothetical protein|nr:hypothetical protein PS865_00455 [Pseudomonas fluorescens]